MVSAVSMVATDTTTPMRAPMARPSRRAVAALACSLAISASTDLSGTTPRRVQRGLAVPFRGAMSRNVVSRAWRKVQADGDAWRRRDLAGEDIVRLILDGAAVTVRLDRKALSPSLLVGRGIRRDGQKVAAGNAHHGREARGRPAHRAG
jgi:transposase-like protein